MFINKFDPGRKGITTLSHFHIYSTIYQEEKNDHKHFFLKTKCKALLNIAAYLTVSSGRLAALSQLSTVLLGDSMCVKDYPHSNHTTERPVAFSHKSH